MTLQQIAEQISNEYGRPLSDLSKKHYSSNTNIHNMKVDFVVKARKEGFSNKQIADFMDYCYTSVSELYNIGMAGEDKFKYEQVLTLMQEGKAVSKDDFRCIRDHVRRLKNKGHHIFKSPQGYKLA